MTISRTLNPDPLYATPKTLTGLARYFGDRAQISSMREHQEFGSLPTIELELIIIPEDPRHGAGPFPTECSVADFGWGNLSEHVDLTNVPNQFQGYFRYGKFDFDEFLGRFNRDYLSSLAIRSKLKPTCFVTHCNEVPMNDILKDFFGYGVYQSSSRYAEDVTEYKSPLEVILKRRKEDDR